jgi:hypothetical protein
MILTLLLASLACGLSDLSGSTPQPQTTSGYQTAFANSLAETARYQTAIAQGVIGTLDSSQQVLPTGTLDKPLVNVSQVTNCRKGPGSTYDWLGTLDVGEQVEVFARDPANTSWYIRNPDNSSGFCWIYGAFASVSGNTNALPVYTPIPTSIPTKTPTATTPPVDFIVSYKSIFKCFTNWQVQFNLFNNSTVTWQSYQTTVTDTVTAKTVVKKSDNFFELINVTNGCKTNNVQDDLAPGESSDLTSFFMQTDQTGHLISASIKLCTLDNLGGTCLTKTLSFTP